MKEKKIRVGIIGASAQYGWSKRAHMPALLALPEFELAAVCTSRPGTATEAAKHYGAKMALHDYHEMVAHPEVDLVSVSVRVPLHHGMVMAALAAGKHVFCEWPLGANLEEAEEMAKTAQIQGVRHMVGLQARGAPALLRLRELLAEGYVGEIMACNMTMFMPGLGQGGSARAWMADRHNGANTLTIAGGHAIDIICFCVGEFQQLSAKVATQMPVWDAGTPGETVPVSAADNVLISGTLAGGAVASAHIATVPWHGTGWKLEVYGREGTLVANCQEMVQLGNIRLKGAHGNAQALEELPIPERLSWVPNDLPQGEPFNVGQLYRSLAQAIRENTKAQPDFQVAVHRHALLDSLQRASDLGQTQQVA